MSRSQPTVENPATKYFDWNAQDGVVEFYDKESEKSVIVDLPFPFLFLDQLSTIRGWDRSSDSAIWSNEVQNTTREPLRVKNQKGFLIAKGLYRNIKSDVKAAGGKFTASVYIAYNEGGQWKIGNIKFKGAAFSEWLDFVNKVGQSRIEKVGVVIVDSEHDSTGSIEYEKPVFRCKDVDEEINQIAVGFDEKLQKYLESRQDEFEEPIEDDQQESEKVGGNLYDDPGEQGEPVNMDENFDDIDDDLPF